MRFISNPAAHEGMRRRVEPFVRNPRNHEPGTGGRRAEYHRAYNARDAAMANGRIDVGAPFCALQNEPDNDL